MKPTGPVLLDGKKNLREAGVTLGNDQSRAERSKSLRSLHTNDGNSQLTTQFEQEGLARQARLQD